MGLLRNILTAVWCAILIGTNVFALIVVLRIYGAGVLEQAYLLLPTLRMVLVTGFSLLALISTKYLWAVLGITVFALLFGVSYTLFAERDWRPANMIGDLFILVPTYLLARWNSAARPTEFNPVKEF